MVSTSVQPRFMIPIDSTRPKGAARFEFWAPKVKRTVTLFTPMQVRLWALLESVPRVSAYCERPTYWNSDKGKQLADFWVRAGRREVCWICSSESKSAAVTTTPMNRAQSIDVRYIHDANIASRSVWIENWMRILPYLAANARLVEDRLLTDIERASEAAPALGEIERDFQPKDIVLVRTAAFMLLHQGRIKADALRVQPLGPRIVFRRTRR
jgi:hypothetical protein